MRVALTALAALVGLVLSLVVFVRLAGDGALAQAPAKFPVNRDGTIVFVQPTSNIGCIFTPQGGAVVHKLDEGPELKCDRVEPEYVRMLLTPKIIQRYNEVADRNCCGAGPIFAYGARWIHGPFVCDSTVAGLTCRRQDGRGFIMSRTNIVAL